ncbi:haloacid dehalogenase [Actinomadura sp. NBRC 104425]|uniref:HAD family hydrolase n=1 Tax=Actinomadura sp. NBRC 104425 TaxID=3032204 RepID=UPI0024A2997B|nr:haloacid dehalogenase-like hydrolase [Actinomadura sp. NBRC 104425]GLZ12560.1 haloacid dehalogenase [Actinomadura sp. NBRC 104425]
MAEPVSKLVLWDVDHTLIETGGVGSEVFKDAFEQVTGRKIDRLADVTGRTEQVIFRETLEMFGIEDPGDYFPEFVQAQAAGYRARADEMRRRGRALPGAREALAALAELPHIIQTVLSGNPRPSAVGKLRVFGLDDVLDLDSGAYGTDDPVRLNLVGIARRRAARRHRVTFTEETTIVIGDTTRDVEAALKGGAQLIAVASGRTPAERLRAAGAATVFPDLLDTTAIVHAITTTR